MTLFNLYTEGTRALEQSGNPDAGNDARQLLLAAFHLDMTHYLLNRMQPLPDSGPARGATDLYREMIGKRRRRVPLQQILGCQEFMGLEFCVNRHVLIPRQDTETLVELVLEEHEEGDRLLDLCTGSGCIAISLAVKGKFSSVTATDISREALHVAKRNGERLFAGAIAFYQGDLFAALPVEASGSCPGFDIITANPPYIPTAVIRTLQPEVRDHEPVLALDGSGDGVYYYRRIAAKARDYLTDRGRLYLEIGHDQGDVVSGILDSHGYRNIRVVKDLPGNDRVVCAAI